ncbi:class I SAM-dependent methyltransferase [Adhaeribacter swui]|uniref:Class I SAM-dependent methyltransferase n=1 Tax=Adhaeribacter swui TaxID=2086471 RepID=A0A7G7G5M3_9BACT|nr:class I SAM-dependent methyltransferase [Adhaeribacter swui]QNF32457.1 class I SAM-dependent methyltransferase [Adhaeribacter swui]
MDVFGQALRDFYTDNFTQKLILHTSYGEPEDMPLDIFFRDEDEMSEVELEALSCCYGKVLDIGAGVGSHALALQELELDVTALEISPLAAEIMQQRGVAKIINQDIFTYSGDTYDTLLLLMNGIGLVGDIAGLRQFLQHAKKLLNPNGQLVFDSSDITYLYEGNFPTGEKYYGEIAYQYEYRQVKGEWFKWLYIDQDTLAEVAGEEGWLTIIQYEDEQDQYLARLILA